MPVRRARKLIRKRPYSKGSAKRSFSKKRKGTHKKARASFKKRKTKGKKRRYPLRKRARMFLEKYNQTSPPFIIDQSVASQFTVSDLGTTLSSAAFNSAITTVECCSVQQAAVFLGAYVNLIKSATLGVANTGNLNIAAYGTFYMSRFITRDKVMNNNLAKLNYQAYWIKPKRDLPPTWTGFYPSAAAVTAAPLTVAIAGMYEESQTTVSTAGDNLIQKIGTADMFNVPLFKRLFTVYKRKTGIILPGRSHTFLTQAPPCVINTDTDTNLGYKYSKKYSRFCVIKFWGELVHETAGGTVSTNLVYTLPTIDRVISIDARYHFKYVQPQYTSIAVGGFKTTNETAANVHVVTDQLVQVSVAA